MKIAVAACIVLLMIPTVSAAEIDAQLDRMAWLIGAWIGEIEGPGGSVGISRLTFEWAEHRRAVRYRIVRGRDGAFEPTLEGIYGWHPTRKQLVLWEVDREGNLTEGTITLGDGRQTHEEVIHGADGSTLPVRVELIREGEDAFLFNALVEKPTGWSVVFRTRYRRVDKTEESHE